MCLHSGVEIVRGLPGPCLLRSIRVEGIPHWTTTKVLAVRLKGCFTPHPRAIFPEAEQTGPAGHSHRNEDAVETLCLGVFCAEGRVNCWLKALFLFNSIPSLSYVRPPEKRNIPFSLDRSVGN